ncbi:MAG TPA: hypothetical protein PLI45_03240 [Candidatus Woesebacteria bacterium]|nr:hypothetical protein [Candidatus Woesebacteria bacterium]
MSEKLREYPSSLIEHEYRTVSIAHHQENLRKIHNLIHRLNSFTIWELKDACRQEKIGPFDVSETLEELLNSLVEKGLLRYEFQTYTVKDE